MKKVIATILLASVVSNSIPNTNIEYKSPINSQTGITVLASGGLGTTVLKTLASFLIDKALNMPLGSYPASIEDHGLWYVVRHKSLTFNSDGVGTTIEKRVIGRGGDRVAPFIIKNHVAIGNRVSIRVYSNGTKIADRSVISQQVVETKLGGFSDAKCNVSIQYTDAYKRSWIPAMIYEFKNLSTPPNVQPYSINNSKNVNYEIYNNKVYIRPMNISYNEDIMMFSKENINRVKEITYDELYNQFYDFESKMLVNQAKNYKSGDIAYIVDKISSVEYDSKNNATYIRFKAENKEFKEHEIMFFGDLTKTYKAGDVLKLKFNIVKEYEKDNVEYVDINYNKEASEKNVIPRIEDYIYK